MSEWIKVKDKLPEKIKFGWGKGKYLLKDGRELVLVLWYNAESIGFWWIQGEGRPQSILPPNYWLPD